jgi:DNA-binding SARP family transcriptional activator
MKLLAYLVLFREQNHAREYVAGLFWGDSNEDRAHSCLRTALWRLRRVLEPQGVPRGVYLLTTAAGEIGFNKESNYWLDVEQLESHAARILKKPCHALEDNEVREIEKILKLYAGDLLEGYYEDWAFNERERLRSLYLKSQAHLLGYYSHKGDYDSALACGHYILNMDPLREEIHREMMRLYMESGRRARAIQQYETIRNLLEAELRVPPMEETRLLRNQIVERSALQPAHSCFQGNDTPHQTLQQIYEALRDLDKVGKKLGRTAARLEKFIDH